MNGSLPLHEQVSLASFNTLAVPARARYFMHLTAPQDLPEALSWAACRELPVLLLGGGSNLVFAQLDVNALVLHMAFRGRRWERPEGDAATLVLAAGENWHEAVIHAASAGYRGIENLALIPGTAGAAPVQNIGAYGVELKDVLESVTVFDREQGQWLTLDNHACAFAYRDSLFKHQPGRFVISEIRLRLSRSRPLQLDYRELREHLDAVSPGQLDAMTVARAVMSIRRRKLPDPARLPNAGSFFKNPVVSEAEYQRLRRLYPDMPAHELGAGVKLAAAWLIEQCGWKGFRNDRVGVHDRQALVLVNHSGGSGQDILALAVQIRESVRSKFGVVLEVEPGVVGTAGLCLPEQEGA